MSPVKLCADEDSALLAEGCEMQEHPITPGLKEIYGKVAPGEIAPLSFNWPPGGAHSPLQESSVALFVPALQGQYLFIISMLVAAPKFWSFPELHPTPSAAPTPKRWAPAAPLSPLRVLLPLCFSAVLHLLHFCLPGSCERPLVLGRILALWSRSFF